MSREDNYHLSSVTVVTSLIANFIHGRSVTRRKHFALRKFWKIKVLKMPREGTFLGVLKSHWGVMTLLTPPGYGPGQSGRIWFTF